MNTKHGTSTIYSTKHGNSFAWLRMVIIGLWLSAFEYQQVKTLFNNLNTRNPVTLFKSDKPTTETVQYIFDELIV